ncbi:2-oxoglutarate-dependent dioxygenase [Caenimonas sedimenti]|uniref:2-oxoglutarate-dependent dioxygenase n=1 Tax=Caenimonas sedimenti TaxID=2596921 RepID=A0A562ZK68_9BURK|nr:2OG-Fe(II) oxygenase [Caenimonas sedimenti]TWO68883.1 2-oxoglutarate-dependent dioxygenase [Caenimonas sedimenti]
MTTTQARQQVTPDLRKWIVEQAEAGHSAESVLQAMLASGWTEDVAVEAMEATLRGHLESKAAEQDQSQPQPVPVPEPALAESPLYIDAGDRQVCVLQTVSDPRIVVFGNLLSDEECDALIALAKPRLARSLTVATKTGGEEVNADRTSNGMFFQRGEHEVVRRLEQRIARLVNWPEENGEGLQILQYGPGAEYKPHYDYFDPVEPGTPTILKRGGQRVATLVMYLGEPTKGGGTVFPDIHLEVAPKRGNGVFFSYDRAHPSTKTLHGGSPVLAGEKWIATKWLRERRFE